VTITIISMLAAMTMGALQMARNSGREAATKATIAKLNAIIMRRYESYMTRRVPIQITGLTPPQAAEVRLGAIRDLMRMEMPDRLQDIGDNFTSGGTFTFTASYHQPGYHNPYPGGSVTAYPASVPEPALHSLYRTRCNGAAMTGPINYPPKIFYMVISMGSPEAMEQFNQSEIKVDTDGWPYFVDGWGQPIYFIRWAPGCFAYSSIQSGDVTNDHDPFDTRNVDNAGYRLIPLIYSYGRSGTANNVTVDNTTTSNGTTTSTVVFYDQGTSALPTTICGNWSSNAASPYQTLGSPLSTGSGAAGNITNHYVEQR
jgi:type II secretory pathway pseudopilin PulG